MTTVEVLHAIYKKTKEPLVLVTDSGFDGLLNHSLTAGEEEQGCSGQGL